MEQPLPSDTDTAALHQSLVDRLVHTHCITTPQVEAAFRVVPRHLFLPDVALDHVYRDEAIPTKKLEDGQAVSASSQPAIMAIMLEQLGLEPGQRVLEIGAGTGYNAALLAQIVGADGAVVTIDIDDDIVEDARAHLAAAGFDQVQVVCGDGGHGYALAAPYDRIILTVGAWEVLPAWREQLRPGGRIVMPLSINGPQKSVAFEHVGDHLASVSVKDCGFMRLRGESAAPEMCVELGAQPGLSLLLDREHAADAEALYQSLAGPHCDHATTIRATPGEIWGSLNFWLALHAPGFCSLSAAGPQAEIDRVPLLFEYTGSWRSRFTHGLSHDTSLCFLMRPPDWSPPEEQSPAPASFELFVRSFGADETIAQRLIDQVTAWDRAGRPATEELRIRVYPNDTVYTPAANESVVEKRWTRLVLDWD
jgi:protein-L-isoaspartate(D-aspartate) O-methyltransferase